MVQTSKKNRVLTSLADLLRQNRAQIIEANLQDMVDYPEMDEAMKDRLKVDEKKIDGMIRSLTQVASLNDPEGKTLYAYTREDGLLIENRTVPFGTILIIYESRPDVTIEAAATAFKAGNRILLKGGKESYHTNSFLTQLWQQALEKTGIDSRYVQYLHLTREETQRLIKENTHRVDLIIPRGGENLIRFIQENTTIPIIVSGRGNNFLYVDKNCDFEMAVRIILNGKKRISVCNALDKVLIDENLPNIQDKIAQLVSALKSRGIEVLGNSSVYGLNSEIIETNDEKVLYEEFLAPKIFLSLVPDITEAIRLINAYSGKHSATIVTNEFPQATRFMQEVDCAAVYHNASTRFTDGGEFGLGAEIAISTQKLHFRGPIGAEQLVTNKWFVYGNGHIRE
ncbi:MAG: glutamate-5-semialdehyde dehydrogenase [Dysgonamonadaceae bacterium]